MRKAAQKTPIVFIAGPALGHIGRLAVIARRLRLLTPRKIVFVTPEHAKFTAQVLNGEFEVIGIPLRSPGVQPDLAIDFADQLESVLFGLRPKIIINDMCPLQWLSFVRFPDCPRITVTNTFLTDLLELETTQKLKMHDRIELYNHYRISRGLPTIKNVYELYKSDIVFLSDPSFLFNFDSPEYIITGAIYWMDKGKLPQKIMPLSDLLLLSMGSSGIDKLERSATTRIAEWSCAKQIVYVGNKVDHYREAQAADHFYSSLPLSEILAKSKIVLTHGGAGSVYSALNHGIPTIIFPRQKNQQILGDIIEAKGLGLCIKGADDIEKLSSSSFDYLQQNATHFSRLMMKEDGPSFIANKIHDFLKC